MPKTRIPSPSRSHSGTTPRRHKPRRSRSVSSPAPSNTSLRLTALIDQYKNKNMQSFTVSPMKTRWSVLTDNTDIEEPRRKSWWKNLNENSQDLMEVLEGNNGTDSNNSVGDINDMDISSQENQNYSLELPESSDNESIHSIVISQRKLFIQKENKPQNKFGQLIGRETLTKLHKSNTTLHEKTIAVGTKDLFQGTKRSKPVFSAALLNLSANKTAVDKTTENITTEPKTLVKNIFGHRPAQKRKNIFADFIVSDSEHETSEIQLHTNKNTIKKVQKASDELVNQANQDKIINTEQSERINPEQVQEKNDDNKSECEKINQHKVHTEVYENLKLNQVENKIYSLVDSRNTTNKFQDPNIPVEEIIASPENVLQHTSKSKTVISALNISANKTVANESVEKVTEPKIKPIKNLFGKRLDDKHKNIFADFNVSDNEHESSELQAPIIEVASHKSFNANEKRADQSNKGNEIDTSQSRRLNLDRGNKEDDTENKLKNKCQELNIDANDNLESNQPHKKIRKLVDTRETMDKLLEISITQNDHIVTAGPKDLFHGTTRSNKIFSSTLLALSPNKTFTDNVETNLMDPNIPVKNILCNRSGIKHINIFADFLEAESEHEISEIQNLEKEKNDVINVDRNPDNILKLREENANDSGDKEINVELSVKNNHKDVLNQNDEDFNDKRKRDNREKCDKQIRDVIETRKGNIQNEKSIETTKQGNYTREKIVAQTEEEAVNENEVAIMHCDDSDENNQKEVRSRKDGSLENEDIDKHMDETNLQNTCQKKEGVENEEHKAEDFREKNKSKKQTDIENEVKDAHINEDAIQEVKELDNRVIEVQYAEDNPVNILNQNEKQESNKVNESQEEGCIEDEEIDVQSGEDSDEAIVSQYVEEDDNESEDNEEINYEESDEEEEEGVENNEDAEIDKEDDNYEDSDEEFHEVNKCQDDQLIQNKKDEEIDEISQEKVISHLEEEEDNGNEEKNYEESNEEINEVNKSQDDEEWNENREVQDNDAHEDESNESENDDEMRYEESDEEVQENMTEREKFIHNKSNIQAKENQAVSKKMNETKEALSQVDSSAEGSGWDSHRTTRKTLRQTFGKNFSPRKSLRALVMEKSAKQATRIKALQSETIMLPLANSTELPNDSNREDNVAIESDHELSRRTRQANLETYLQNIKQQVIEKRTKMDHAIRNSLKTSPARDTLNLFKVPTKPPPRKLKPISNKPKTPKKSMFFDQLPPEVIADMKYKPPKRFQPSNASWITNRLYKFLETKLEPKYDYKARIRAEKLVQTIYHFTRDIHRHHVAPLDAVDVLKHELARLEIVKTHFEFYEFIREYMPREVEVKVIPDIVNKIPTPRHGVFSCIL